MSRTKINTNVICEIENEIFHGFNMVGATKCGRHSKYFNWNSDKTSELVFLTYNYSCTKDLSDWLDRKEESQCN